MKQNGSRAMALIGAMWFSVVVFMAAAVLTQRARTGTHFQLEDAADLAALYAAEAGVQEALALWSADSTKSWGQNPAADSRIDVPLQGRDDARYSIRFGPGESVNNLNQATARDGPLGPNTVPPRMAFLAVTGEYRGRRRRIETLVARTGLVENPAALLGARSIQLSGDITLTGLRTLHQSTRVAADLVCLNSGSADNQIAWTGPGSVNIDGSIASNSSNTGAISGTLSSANVTGGNLTGQNRPNPDRVDITSRVQAVAGSGLPAPTLSGTTSTLTPGDYYLSGNLNYNGDLVLDGANLYVDGNLDVNGSISGTGSVFVTGNSSLYGDSSVRSGDAAGVALFSQGNVTLEGFDGSRLLADLTQNVSPPVDSVTGVAWSTHLSNFLKWSGEMNGLIAETPHGPGAPYHFGVGGSRFDQRILALTRTADAGYAANQLGGETWDITTASGQTLPNAHREMGAQLHLHRLVAGQPDSASIRFLKKKFRELNGGDFGQTAGTDLGEYLGPFGRPPDPSQGVSWTDEDVLRRALDGSGNDGFFRTLGSVWPQLWDGSYPHGDLVARRQELWQIARNQLAQLSLDKPGMAYFQGLIYSTGNITARNDLHVIGAIMAAGSDSEVRLNNGVRVLFVPELVRASGSSLGRVAVRTWMRR